MAVSSDKVPHFGDPMRNWISPRTPEAGPHLQPANSWGFQLSPEAAAGKSLRGGTSSFVAPAAPLLSVHDSGLVSSSSTGSLQQHSRSNGALSTNYSSTSLRQENAGGLHRTSPHLTRTWSGLEEKVPEVPRLRPDWAAFDSRIVSPSRQRTESAPSAARQMSTDRVSTPSVVDGAILLTPRTANSPTRPVALGSSSRKQSPENSVNSLLGSPAISHQLAEMSFKVETVLKDASETSLRIESHEERIIALQRVSEVFEERFMHANACIQRAGAENRQKFEEFQIKLDERGETVELKSHLQWAESRIHQLTARVAASEELLERLKQHTLGPGKNAWDVWEVAEARRDLELMREELTLLKTAGVVTPQMLSEAMDPLRRELRQLAERLVQGLNADVSSIVDTLMQEVMQVRELATVGDKVSQRDNAVIKQELMTLASRIPQHGDGVSRQELKDAADAIRCEIHDAVSREELKNTAETIRCEIRNAVSRQELRSEAIRSEVSQLVEGSATRIREETADLVRLRNGVKESGVGSTGNIDEICGNLRDELTQSVEELRTWVLQLVRHVEKSDEMVNMVESLRAMVESLQASVPSKQQLAELADRVDHCAVQMPNMSGDALYDLCPDEAAQRLSSLSGPMTKEGVPRAASSGGSLRVPEQRPSYGSLPSSDGQGVTPRRSKLDIVAARVSQLLNSQAEATITKREFLEAMQDLRWDLVQVEEMAECGNGAAGAIFAMKDKVVIIEEEVKSLRVESQEGKVETQKLQRAVQKVEQAARENHGGVMNSLRSQDENIKADVRQEHNISLVESDLLGRSVLTRAMAVQSAANCMAVEEHLCSTECRLSGVEAGLVDLRRMHASTDHGFEDLRKMMGEVVNSVERGMVTSSSPASTGLDSTDNFQMAWLLGRVCISRAIALHSCRLLNAASRGSRDS